MHKTSTLSGRANAPCFHQHRTQQGFPLGVAFCLMLGLFVLPVGADDRPNVVLIMADDLGYEAVGCYGGTSYETPNIDQLASQGIRFDRAYSMPLCTNTRIQLMTGKYNNRNWLGFGLLAPKEATFGQLMQRAGYKTCIAGKWQLTSYDPLDYPGAELRRNAGTHPRDAGFDEYSLWHVAHTEDKGSRYADPVIYENGRLRTDTQGRYGPDIWTDFIGDFVSRHQNDPFFVYYSMALPHNPMVPTPDSPEWRDAESRHVDHTRFAADMIEYTDKMVGKVVDQIDNLQLTRPTLILFYSDNGTNWRVSSRLGDRLVRGGKGSASELGIRVPLIARWSGVSPAGATSQVLIDSTDFLPTILEAAGHPELTPSPIDGLSFYDTLTAPSKGRRRWVYIHQDPRPGWDKDRFGLTRVAINDRFKLYEDGRLFDLVADRFEETPRFIAADDDAQGAQRAALQDVLDAMKPFPAFDPTSVPRPDSNEFFQRHQFHDQGGCVTIEAEELPIPSDESWASERTLPAYTGIGYLRALQDQPSLPNRGVARISVCLDIAGPWSLAVRCRSDHYANSHEHEFWIKIADGPWLVGKLPPSYSPGTWTWVNSFAAPTLSEAPPTTYTLQERGNELWIAPRTANLKIDRLVLFQADQRRRGLDLSTPAAPYHPWASP